MGRTVIGILLILAALLCAVGAFMNAGGMHGFNEFNPERLFQGGGFVCTSGTVALLLLGLIVLFRGRTTQVTSAETK